jgi:hypothetical protein
MGSTWGRTPGNGPDLCNEPGNTSVARESVPMSDEFIPFWRLLVSAEEQLQWGLEPETMEVTARALACRHPGSALAERLMARAASVRAMGTRMPSHGARTAAAPAA